MRKIEGTVRSYTPISVRNVQFEIDGSSELIDLHSEFPWLLKETAMSLLYGWDQSSLVSIKEVWGAFFNGLSSVG